MANKPYYILYGAIGTAAVAAFVAFLQQWDVLFYLAIVTLFYVGLWAVGRASSLEKENRTRFTEAETLRERMREQQNTRLHQESTAKPSIFS